MQTHYRLKIITTDPTLNGWRTLPEKIARVETALNTVQNGSFEIVTEYRPLSPVVVNTRITHDWMDTISYPEYRLGYDFVALHMSSRQRIAFNIDRGVRGVYHLDKDFVSETYFWSDEHTKRNGLSQLEQTLLHELSHALSHGCKVVDLTHEWHNKHPDIRGIFPTYNMALYQKEAKGMEAVLRRAQAEINVLSVGLTKYPQRLWPRVARKANELERLCAMEGFPIRITEGVRSCERQNALYAQGRTLPLPVVTNAKCGESLHQYGVAFDIVFRNTGYQGPWERVGELGESLGLQWGGRWTAFPDRPHFELRLTYTLADFQRGRINYRDYF